MTVGPSAQDAAEKLGGRPPTSRLGDGDELARRDSRVLRRFMRTLSWAENACALVAATCLVVILLVVNYGVAGRQLTDLPTGWTLEVTEYGMLVITYLAAPWVFREGGHVSVDIIVYAVGVRVRAALQVVSYGLATVALGLLVFFGLETAMDYSSRGIVLERVLSVPQWPLLATIPLAGTLLALRMISNIMAVIGEARQLPAPGSTLGKGGARVEWWLIVSLFLGVLVSLLLTGLPVAFSFLTANFLVVGLVFGTGSGFNQLVLSMFEAVAKFTLTPIPFFVLLGELLFRSGLAVKALDVLSMFLGRLPGRLSLLAVGSGTMFAALSGSSIANTSMLGSLLVPDMRRRGYAVSMSAGPIMAAGTLAMLIPPSAMAVLLGSIGKISISGLLIGGILPGLLMAGAFVAYIIIANKIKPGLAPVYEVVATPWRARLVSLATDVAPLVAVICVVVGGIFLGWMTPTESASLGALLAIVVITLRRKLNRQVIFDSIRGTLRITGMVMLILAFAAGYSQLLAFSGATRELIELTLGAELSSEGAIIVMLGIVLVLGCFLEQTAIMMITLPMFMPVVANYEINPVWFGIMLLIALDLGGLTPPFGFSLFVMKGVVPKDISMGQIYLSAVPYIAIEVCMLFVLLMWPNVVLFLPGLGTG